MNQWQFNGDLMGRVDEIFSGSHLLEKVRLGARERYVMND
jgi:hypothetical protein